MILMVNIHLNQTTVLLIFQHDLVIDYLLNMFYNIIYELCNHEATYFILSGLKYLNI